MDWENRSIAPEEENDENDSISSTTGTESTLVSESEESTCEGYLADEESSEKEYNDTPMYPWELSASRARLFASGELSSEAAELKSEPPSPEESLDKPDETGLIEEAGQLEEKWPTGNVGSSTEVGPASRTSYLEAHSSGLQKASALPGPLLDDPLAILGLSRLQEASTSRGPLYDDPLAIPGPSRLQRQSRSQQRSYPEDNASNREAREKKRGNQCKKSWKKVKDNYWKNVRKVKLLTGSAKKWALSDRLKFLSDIERERSSFSSIPEQDSTNIEDGQTNQDEIGRETPQAMAFLLSTTDSPSASSSLAIHRSTKKSWDRIDKGGQQWLEFLQRLVENKHCEDDVDLFMKNIAVLVKKLPPNLINKAQMNILRYVSEHSDSSPQTVFIPAAPLQDVKPQPRVNALVNGYCLGKKDASSEQLAHEAERLKLFSTTCPTSNKQARKRDNVSALVTGYWLGKKDAASEQLAREAQRLRLFSRACLTSNRQARERANEEQTELNDGSGTEIYSIVSALVTGYWLAKKDAATEQLARKAKRPRSFSRTRPTSTRQARERSDDSASEEYRKREAKRPRPFPGNAPDADDAKATKSGSVGTIKKEDPAHK